MKAYKLTNSDGFTYNETKWGENITHTAKGTNKDLCSDGFIHFYEHPLIAVLMNPIHANFKDPLLWECETDGEHMFEATKAGCKSLTTIKVIPVPIVTTTQRVAFGILCVKEIIKDSSWSKWADNWLSSKNRTKSSTYQAISSAARVATYSSHAAAAARDAAAAARAARDAAYATYAAYSAHAAAHATAYAAAAAVAAAAAAARAAARAADTNAENATAAAVAAAVAANFIDFRLKIVELAEKALTY